MIDCLKAFLKDLKQTLCLHKMKMKYDKEKHIYYTECRKCGYRFGRDSDE